MRASSLALIVSAAVVSCGARTGLSTSGPPADAGVRDAGRLDAGRDASTGCPFAIDERISGMLQTCVDDNARFIVNGVLVDDTPRSWEETAVFTVPLFRHPMIANVIAVEGINVFRIDGRDRGVLIDLRASTEAGPVAVVTDGSWRLETIETPLWEQSVFDDSRWRTPVLEVPHGSPPWGPVFGTSTASWLWSYDSDRPASAKPERERVFLRRTFYFDVRGNVVDEPTPCP